MSCFRFAFCVGLALGTLSLAGCGEDTFEMASASGTVKFNDGSIPQGEMITVRFEPNGIPPVGNKVAQPASGDLQPDGSFSLRTHAEEGAAVGKYDAFLTVIKKYGETPPVEYSLGPAQVKSGESNVFDFKVDKAAGKQPGQ